MNKADITRAAKERLLKRGLDDCVLRVAVVLVPGVLKRVSDIAEGT
jgi:hypothetical protein